jgi:hypothetical protein
MAVKIFSNNMDEPNLKEAIKKDDLNDMTEVLVNLKKKIERMGTMFHDDIREEDEFAGETFERFHVFYSFVLFQTVIIIVLGIYQVFTFRKKILA